MPKPKFQIQFLYKKEIFAYIDVNKTHYDFIKTVVSVYDKYLFHPLFIENIFIDCSVIFDKSAKYTITDNNIIIKIKNPKKIHFIVPKKSDKRKKATIKIEKPKTKAKILKLKKIYSEMVSDIKKQIVNQVQN